MRGLGRRFDPPMSTNLFGSFRRGIGRAFCMSGGCFVAISNAPWNFTPHDYSGTADYCDACLINLNDGPREQWTQANCKLPIKEPSGDINVNGVHAAAAALSGARGGIKSVSADVKRAAAKALVKAYSQIHGDPPAGIARMAGM